MDDTEQNKHEFLKFQIMNPYPIHSMTQESPTHSLWLMAYPSMERTAEEGPACCLTLIPRRQDHSHKCRDNATAKGT